MGAGGAIGTSACGLVGCIETEHPPSPTAAVKPASRYMRCNTVFATIWFSLCLADIKQFQCQSKINLSYALSVRHGKCLNILTKGKNTGCPSLAKSILASALHSQ
jgi:hypothetical protein